ncbi:MAG: chloramphenicol acetyltransferase [Acidobacteriota bacterium]
MATYLDINSWPRRQHFAFFRDFELPFFNLSANVDVTAALEACRGPDRPSFSVVAFYQALRAVNALECFRYRLRGDRVLIHDTVRGGTTTLRDDDTFGFGYFDYHPDFDVFARGALEGLAAAKAARDLVPSGGDDDVIHFSVIPWVSFTSFQHAKRTAKPGADFEDSVPKIVFGKYFEDRGRRWLPTSVEVHHALMDGLHVGRFFEQFQAFCEQPLPGGRPSHDP